MGPKDVEGIADSVDPDQTAGSTLFAQAYICPKNLGSLRVYSINVIDRYFT